AGSGLHARWLPGSTVPTSRSSPSIGATGDPSPATAAILVNGSGTGAGSVTASRWATTRWWVVAATVAFHGAVLATVPVPGPSLPAEAATKMPAPNASRNARSTRLFQGLSGPEME